MTIVGRAKIDHPALGTSGGSTLHSAVETIYTNIGDHLSGRFVPYSSIGNSVTATIDHNFGVQFSDLKILFYTGSHPNLVRVTDPAAAGYTIAATTGDLKTKIDVTTPSSGGPHTFALFVTHGRGAEKLSDLDDINFSTAPIANKLLAYNAASSKWEPANISFSFENVTIASNTITAANTETAKRITGTAADLQMIAGPAAGKYLILVNDTGSDVLVKHDTGATSANRIFTSNAEDVTLKDNTALSLVYDSTVSRWIVIGGQIPLTLLNRRISSTDAITGALHLPGGTSAERPGTPVAGQIRYNSDTSSFEGYSSGAWSGIGGGGTLDRITQAAHSFVVGDILYLNGTTYTKAIASAANTAEVVGMVSRVIDVTTFELTLSGEVSGLTGLTAGEAYFLSPSSAGAMTVTEPTVIGQVSFPLGVASSTTTFYVAPKRGVIVGGANARTQLSLTNSTTANIQDVSVYDAGSLTGWIYIDAGTDYRFYVDAPFAKNGAGSNWNISPSYVGDTPPAGFSITITSLGVIQYTMPTVASFSSGIINYALNAPAVGATFPLSVDSTSINVINSAPLSYRNKIINGNFDVWQRGTSQTAHGYGSDDRWFNGNVGSTKIASRQAFTLGQTSVSGEPTYFSRTVVTSVNGASNACYKVQPIEGVRNFAGQNATLSFWAKSDANRNIAVEFIQSFGSGGSPSSNVVGIGVTTCALTTNWQKFTVTVAIPSINGKILGTDNNDWVGVEFWFDAGSSLNSRTNSLGQQSGTFDIAQVQMEAGLQATAFEQRPIGMELGLCQRYFEILQRASLDNDIPVSMVSSTNGVMWLSFKTEKRAIPTLWTDSSGNFGRIVRYTSSFVLSQTGATGLTSLGTTTSSTSINIAGSYVGTDVSVTFDTVGTTRNIGMESEL